MEFKNDGLIVMWRVQGKGNWNREILSKDQLDDHYIAYLPLQPMQTIEYFISAETIAGNKETMPRTAPAGLYSYTAKEIRR